MDTKKANGLGRASPADENELRRRLEDIKRFWLEHVDDPAVVEGRPEVRKWVHDELREGALRDIPTLEQWASAPGVQFTWNLLAEMADRLQKEEKRWRWDGHLRAVLEDAIAELFLTKRPSLAGVEDLFDHLYEREGIALTEWEVGDEMLDLSPRLREELRRTPPDTEVAELSTTFGTLQVFAQVEHEAGTISLRIRFVPATALHFPELPAEEGIIKAVF